MQKTKAPHGYWWNLFIEKCPRCREGKMFKNKLQVPVGKNVEMNMTCPVCNQPTEIEVGFYYGTGYVSYGLTVLLTAFSFVLWLVLIGISLEDNRIFWWLGINAVLLLLLQPWMMRFSRVLWLSWFVKYDPNWEEHQHFNKERILENQMEGKQSIHKATLD
jgi:hypothetical protein